MYTNAWRTGHKIAWKVTRSCRGYLVDTVLALHVDSLRASLLHRQVGVFHVLLRGPCKKATVAALLASRYKQSILGANLALIGEKTELDPWTSGKRELQAALEESEIPGVPDKDQWRIAALEKLLSARLTAEYQADKTEADRLQDLIDSLVIN